MERKFMSKYHQDKWQQAELRRVEVRKLREQGKTWPEIGKVMGLTPQRVQQMGKSNV